MANSYARLTEQELNQLRRQNESPTLEFKSRWYKIAKTYGDETSNPERAELIKDILSLANGNADVAGDTAYLIIGADDHLDSDGNRPWHDVTDVVPPAKELLQKINPYCDPPLGHLCVDAFNIEGCRVYVLTLPPGPHLYETKQPLEPSKGHFSERTVFVRHGEHVEIASTRERVTLMQVKQGRFRDSRNAPSVLVGASAGALVGGAIAYAMGEQVLSDKNGLSNQEKKIISGISGTGAGALLGGLLGEIAIYLKEILIDWPRKPLWDKLFTPFPFLLGAFVTLFMSNLRKGRKSSE